jgi:hypothetical protein
MTATGKDTVAVGDRLKERGQHRVVRVVELHHRKRTDGSPGELLRVGVENVGTTCRTFLDWPLAGDWERA